MSGKVGYLVVNHWVMRETDGRLEYIRRHQSNIVARTYRAG